MSTSLSINSSLPWTERIWKQLLQSDKPANALLFFGKQGFGKNLIALRYADQVLASKDVFSAANHPDMHVIMPEMDAELHLEVDHPESHENDSKLSIEVLLSQYAKRYLEKSKTKAKTKSKG